MSILPTTNTDPIGAAALPGHADPAELVRFIALEDAVWGKTTLPPSVIEAVRLHCAQIRGCAFCSAVRVSAAIEDGVSEAQIAELDKPEARGRFSAEQAAELRIALGENLEPYGSCVVERARGDRVERPSSTSWPALSGPVLDPDMEIPAVAPGLAKPIRERVTALWSGTDMPRERVAASASADPIYLGITRWNAIQYRRPGVVA